MHGRVILIPRDVLPIKYIYIYIYIFFIPIEILLYDFAVLKFYMREVFAVCLVVVFYLICKDGAIILANL